MRPADLERMVNEVEFDDLRFYEISARARDGFQLPEPADPEDAPADMRVQVRVRPRELGIRVRMGLLTEDAEVHADAVVTYSAERILEYPAALVARFVTQVGIKTLFPFLREAVAEATRRVGVEPHVLGVFRPDEIDVDDQLTQEIARSQADAGSGEDERADAGGT